MHYAIKMWITDLVLYMSALGWCWQMGWGYAFAGLGAFATIYLTKGFIKLVRLHYTLKKMDEEVRDQWGD